MAGISIWQLVIIAVIVILLFGTKKLRNLGSDLGSAVKGFKKAVSDEEKADEKKDVLADKSAANTNTNTNANADVKEKDKV